MLTRPEAALRIMVAAVEKAINRRLEVIHAQCGILANDMQSAMYRIDTQRQRVNLDDIRVGTYHRYSTELTRLQWFMNIIESSRMKAPDLLSLVELALQANIETLRRQNERVNQAMAATLERIDSDETWSDIRTAAWYKASTEGRVYRWLISSLQALGRDEAIQPLDQEDEDN